jgi:hypothetical protein
MSHLAEIQPRGAMPKEKFEPLAKEIFTLKKTAQRRHPRAQLKNSFNPAAPAHAR